MRKLLMVAAAVVFSFVFAGAAYGTVYSDDTNVIIEESNEFITMVSLNFRSGPSTDYPRISLLQPGTAMVVLEYEPDGFSYVEVDGVLGFVATEFIIRRPAPGAPLPPGTVELLSWREVYALMPKGSIIQVYDVRSGLTYNVRVFSKGAHADVETVTREDTRIFEASIGNRFSWDPRPVLVTWTAIEGRIIAASIHGMPHAGWTIPDNDMDGHICIHFHGGTNSNPTWNAQMQAAVREAYNSRR